MTSHKNRHLLARPGAVAQCERWLSAMLLVTALGAPAHITSVHAADPLTTPRIALSKVADDGEADAAALLEEAHEELELGERRSALRRLEILVHRYPRTRSATEARVLIGQLRAGLDAPPERERRSPPTQGTAEQSPPTRLTEIRHLKTQFQSIAGDRVFFARASAEIGSRARLILEQQADWLRRHPTLRIVIEGHADDGGTEPFNAELAQRRADGVRDRLLAAGIGGDRIDTAALGSQKRVATCDGPSCAAQNRRVIIRLSGEGRR